MLLRIIPLVLLVVSAPAAAAARDAADPAIVFVDVNVVPMDRDIVLRHHVVEVRGSMISYVGPSRGYSVPAGARIIQARGKFMIPGLADMHMHVAEPWRAGGFLAQYVAFGVTSLRSLSGDPALLRLRDSIDRGEMIAPRLWVSGPIITGQGGNPDSDVDKVVASSPAEARQIVSSQIDAGYDVIKLYDLLSRDAFLAAVHEAKRRGAYVVGHLPDAVKLETALSSGLDEIAHADELVSYHWIGYDPAHADWQVDLTSFKIDYERIPETASLLLRHRQSVVSNLVTDETVYRGIEDSDALLRETEYRRLPGPLRHEWSDSGRFLRWKGQGPYRREVIQPFLKRLVLQLNRSGVPLTVGSDLGVEGIVPGHHLLRDIEILEEAGLTPFDALAAATRNAALVAARMRKPDNFGTIANGQRADLVLLSRNPLETVRHLRTVRGVMVKGRWLTGERLKAARLGKDKL